MLAALLEWFLWLAAFCYCLAKAYKKSQHWSEKILAVAMVISFVALRFVGFE
jgi:chitin synthase